MRKGVFALCSLTGAVSGAALVLMATSPNRILIPQAAVAATADTYRQLNMFGSVFERVRDDYLDKPDDTKLIQDAIGGMLKSLDSSSYIPAEVSPDKKEQVNEGMGGIGVELSLRAGMLTIASRIGGSRPEKGSLCPRDVITHLDEESTLGLTLDQAITKIRGPLNTKLRLKVTRPGIDQPIDVVVTRQKIYIRPVQYRVEANNIGYLRITTFNDQTAEAVKLAVMNLKSQLGDKLNGYILDLRDNSGGLLDQAISVSDAFLENGTIVETRGRTAEATRKRGATAGDLANGKPMVVLINGVSAAASEIVAAALQFHKRATVVGSRSLGRGSVQTVIPLGKDNGTLQLTTSYAYTPTGLAIQGNGITPDVAVEEKPPAALNTQANACTGEFDAALGRAVEVLRGKT